MNPSTIIVVVVLVGIVFFVLKAIKKRETPAAPPQNVAPAPPPVPQYVPDSSTIKDNASGAEYRDNLAPSTRAFMRPGPYFAPDGTPLDVRGNPILPQGSSLKDVVIPEPTNPTEREYRGKLELAIKTGNPYTFDDIYRAGFDPNSAEFAAWFRKVK